MKKKTRRQELPCEIGDTIYYVANGIKVGTVVKFYVYVGNAINLVIEFPEYKIEIDSDQIGKTLFFTREEAENIEKGGDSK